MCSKTERGLTLIELLVFIVIVGIAANAMLAVFSSLTRNSASLLPDKQAQAIAASLMNEVMAQPFTFCDPNDANAATATSTAGCASLPEIAMAPEAGETRGGPSPFDNVNDYNGYATTGDVLAGLPGLAGYTVNVAVALATAAISGVPANQILRITVTVTPPVGSAAPLEGVRMRYAPQT